MKKEFDTYCKDKRIIVVGNSEIVFQEKRGEFVDSHDVIIRFNHGWPWPYKEYIGTRTDIWSTNLKVFKDNLVEHYHKLFNKRKYTLYPCFPITEIHPLLESIFYMLPFDNWADTYKKLNYDIDLINYSLEKKPSEGNIPTAGSLVLNYIINKINYKILTVIGFDFLKTKNFYTKNRTGRLSQKKHSIPKHSPEKEKKFITGLLENAKNINWIR